MPYKNPGGQLYLYHPLPQIKKKRVQVLWTNDSCTSIKPLWRNNQALAVGAELGWINILNRVCINLRLNNAGQPKFGRRKKLCHYIHASKRQIWQVVHCVDDWAWLNSRVVVLGIRLVRIALYQTICNHVFSCNTREMLAGVLQSTHTRSTVNVKNRSLIKITIFIFLSQESRRPCFKKTIDDSFIFIYDA